MTLEMGKRIDEARGEVEYSSRILAYYAKGAERFLAPVKLHPTHRRLTWRAARYQEPSERTWIGDAPGLQRSTVLKAFSLNQ